MVNAESWADNLRYGRDWRGPVEVSKEQSHPRFNLCVFLDDAHREAWLEEQRLFGSHGDCLTEREMAVCVGAKDREALLEYFDLNDDANRQELRKSGQIAIYARSCTMGLLGPECCKDMRENA